MPQGEVPHVFPACAHLPPARVQCARGQPPKTPGADGASSKWPARRLPHKKSALFPMGMDARMWCNGSQNGPEPVRDGAAAGAVTRDSSPHTAHGEQAPRSRTPREENTRAHASDLRQDPQGHRGNDVPEVQALHQGAACAHACSMASAPCRKPLPPSAPKIPARCWGGSLPRDSSRPYPPQQPNLLRRLVQPRRHQPPRACSAGYDAPRLRLQAPLLQQHLHQHQSRSALKWPETSCATRSTPSWA